MINTFDMFIKIRTRFAQSFSSGFTPVQILAFAS